MDASLPSIDNTVDGTIPSAAILASMENATFIMPTDDGMQGQDVQQTTMYTMEQVSLPHDGLVDHRTAEFHSNVFLIANPTNAEGFDGTQYLSADQQCLYVVDPSMTQVGNIGIVEGATFNLVEMAPMAMGNSTDQTYRYDTGTSLPADDVISDAQAAELLMKVSESRNHDIPYVHVQLAHNSDGYTQLVEVPMENGGGLLGAGYQPMVCVQSVAQGNWTTQSVMDTTATTTKYSDIVSASMEAISFPDNATTTMNLTSVSQDFVEYDENTVTYEEQIKSLPRPVRSRESIEARINRLLRGQNADDASKSDKPPDKPTTNPISTLSKPASPKVVSSTVKPSVGKLLKSKLAETHPAAPPAAKKKIIMHMDGIDLPLEVNMTDNTQINLPLNPPPVPMNTGSNVDDDLEVIHRHSKARTRETAGKYAIKVGMRTIQTSSTLLKQRRPSESKTEQVANMAFSDDMDTAGEIEVEYIYSATTPKNAPPPQVKVIVPVKTSFPSTPTINPQLQTIIKPSIPYTPRIRGSNKRLAASSDPNAPTSIDLHDCVPEDELNVKLPWMKPVEEESEPPKTRNTQTRTRRMIMSNTAPVVKVYGVAQPNLSRIQPKFISTSISSLADDEEELDHSKNQSDPVPESVIMNDVAESAESQVVETNEVKPESQVAVPVLENEQKVEETVPTVPVPVAEVKERTPSPVWTSPCKPDEDYESGLRFRVVRTYTRQRPPKKRKRSALFLVSDDEDEEEEEDDAHRSDHEDRTAGEEGEESKQSDGAVTAVQEELSEPGGGKGSHPENGSKEDSGKDDSSGPEVAPPEETGCETRDESTGIGGDGSAKQNVDKVTNKENPTSEEKEEAVDDQRREKDKQEKKRKRSSSVSSSEKKRHHSSRAEKSKSRHSSSDKVPGISSKPCPKCHERFTTSTGFVKHVAQHGVTERRLACLLCKWQSKGNSKVLEAHILEKHKSKLPS